MSNPLLHRLTYLLRTQKTYLNEMVLSSTKIIRKLVIKKINLSYDITSGSDIMPCNKIDEKLLVYRFSENVMTSITKLHT